jgi:tripartite-type tricarboxylate transporter receptor subunit TctC
VRTAVPSDFITSAGRRGGTILPSRDLIANDIEVAGKVTVEHLAGMAGNAIRVPGVCSGMGAANSMHIVRTAHTGYDGVQGSGETVRRILAKLSGDKKVQNLIRAISMAAMILGLSIPGGAPAQAFPTKPVRVVVPNAPGGAIDILARLLQQQLQGIWAQSIIVEYKPGAGTVLGTDYVAKSAPDGHTLGMVVTSHVINPSLRRDLPFDTLKDFSGVTMTAISHVLISAAPSFEAKNLAEVIALAKKQPGKYSYASPGSGSSMHLAGEMLKTMTGIDLLHVPYKGSGPAYPDVASGRVQLMIDPLFSSLPHIKAGNMKPIAVTAANRAPGSPEIPAVAETVPGFNVQSIFGIVVPSATPREIVSRISADIVTALKAPDLRKRMAEVGLEPVGNTPEQFDAIIRAEIEKWARVVKASGANAD